jgi:hypothetical protein
VDLDDQNDDGGTSTVLGFIGTSSSSAATAALQPLLGFGFLHNSPPPYSVLYSSSPACDPITTLSTHFVRDCPFLLQENNLPLSIL